MDSFILWIISFLGGVLTLLTPVLKLNATITKLTTIVDALENAYKTSNNKNDKDHTKFYNRIETLENDMVEVKTKIKLYHDNK